MCRLYMLRQYGGVLPCFPTSGTGVVRHHLRHIRFIDTGFPGSSPQTRSKSVRAYRRRPALRGLSLDDHRTPMNHGWAKSGRCVAATRCGWPLPANVHSHGLVGAPQAQRRRKRRIPDPTPAQIRIKPSVWTQISREHDHG